MASTDMGSILGGSGVVLSILGMIYTAINHKRIRGRCCGKEIDFEVNIDSTEPATATGAATPASSAPTSTLQQQEEITIGLPKPPAKPGAKVHPFHTPFSN